MWIATQSRPDLVFDVCQLSIASRGSKVDDLLEANKLVRRLKEGKYALFYSSLEDLSCLAMESLSDASFANLNDGGSQGGYVILLSDGRGSRCLLSWRSCKIKRVVKSTIAAETLALLDRAEAAVLLAHMIAKFLECEAPPIVKCFVDNRSLVDAIYSTKLVEDKILRINMAVLRDMIDRGAIHSVSWVQSSMQLADVLTKKGANAQSLIAAISR